MPNLDHYLDHNASAPLRLEVAAAVVQALHTLPGNPHSPHAAGRAAAEALEAAREQVANLLDRTPRQVLFCSGATEANAWALRGARAEGPVLASAVEHPSVLAWADELLPVDPEGRVDLDALEGRLRGPRPGIVSVMAANNETGVLQPLDEVARLCRAAGVPLHVDATQVLGRLPLRIDADLLSLSAHKAGGPKGVGVLVAARPPPALLRGGPQERGARAGTPALPPIMGMGALCALLAAEPAFPSAERDRLEAACRDLGGRILGQGAPRLPNTVAALFPEAGDLLVMALDLEGIAASAGAACASGAARESHVLRAMGLSGLPVRFSLGPESRVDGAIAALGRVLDRVRRAA